MYQSDLMGLERITLNKITKHIFHEHIERYNFALNYCRNKNVLDIACGIGYGSKILKSNKSKKIVSADISSKALSIANKLAKSNYILMDASTMSLIEGTFDVVCSFETIEHLKNHQKFLEEIKRVLRPNGILIISTPTKEFWSPYSDKPANPFHMKEFSIKEFYKIIQNNFKIINIYGQELSGLKRFIMYPYEKITQKMFRDKKILLNKITEKIQINKTSSKNSIFPLKKHRLNIPKYMIIVCKNEQNIKNIESLENASAI